MKISTLTRYEKLWLYRINISESETIYIAIPRLKFLTGPHVSWPFFLFSLFFVITPRPPCPARSPRSSTLSLIVFFLSDCTLSWTGTGGCGGVTQINVWAIETGEEHFALVSQSCLVLVGLEPFVTLFTLSFSLATNHFLTTSSLLHKRLQCFPRVTYSTISPFGCLLWFVWQLASQSLT